MSDDEKVIGNMCLMDGEYMWCSYSESIVFLAVGLDCYLPLANDEITAYNNECELQGRCCNFDCKYNKDKQLSYTKKVVKDIEFNDEEIKNMQGKFNDMTKILSDTENSDELIEMLNSGGMVQSGFEWFPVDENGNRIDTEEELENKED